MRTQILSIILSLTTITSFAQSDLPGKRFNGCGPEKVGFLVPDRIGTCKLTEACNTHDLCYSACLEGGSLVSTGVCGSGQAAASARKRQCDARFYDDIVATNQGECGAWAALYKYFVSKLGSCCFAGMQVDTFERIVRNARTPDDAMRQLKYIEIIERTNAVDLSKITFKADGTLVIPTVKPLENLRDFKLNEVIVPKASQLTEQRLREAARSVR